MHTNHTNAATTVAGGALCLEQRLSAVDDLSGAVRKAQALSLMTYGEAGQSFRSMGDGAQDYFLWALHGLLCDAVEALDRLTHLGGVSMEGGAA